MNCNIRNVDPEIMRRLKVYAASQGKTMRQVAIELFRELVEGEGIERTHSLVREGAHAATDDLTGDSPRAGKIVVKEDSLDGPTGKRGGVREGVEGSPEIPSAKICPEDAKVMIWNKVLKCWECECGYRTKGAK
jgi:plasmid stability protein